MEMMRLLGVGIIWMCFCPWASIPSSPSTRISGLMFAFYHKREPFASRHCFLRAKQVLELHTLKALAGRGAVNAEPSGKGQSQLPAKDTGQQEHGHGRSQQQRGTLCHTAQPARLPHPHPARDALGGDRGGSSTNTDFSDFSFLQFARHEAQQFTGEACNAA